MEARWDGIRQIFNLESLGMSCDWNSLFFLFIGGPSDLKFDFAVAFFSSVYNEAICNGIEHSNFDFFIC